MNIWIVIIVIAAISIVLAVFSLKEMYNRSEVEEAKKKLSKGRVIFQDNSSSSSKL